MWLISTSGFISVVKDRDSDQLWVRARVKDDLRAHFPKAKIKTLRGADYLYRAKVTRRQLARVLTELVDGLDYTSHVKEVVADRAPLTEAGDRYEGMLDCWQATSRWQAIPPFRRVPLDPDDAPDTAPGLPAWADQS